MKSKWMILLLQLLFLFWNATSLAQSRRPLLPKLYAISGKLDFARDVQRLYHDPSANAQLKAAEANLELAKEQLRLRRPLLADRSMNEANRLITEALMMMLQEPLRLRRQKLEFKIQQSESLAAHFENPEAKQRLQKAIENKNLAEQSFKDREFQKSWRHFLQAESQVQQALDLFENRETLLREQVAEEAAQYQQLATRASSLLANSADQDMLRNYRAAVRLSQKAERSTADGNWRLASDYYHRAIRLLLRTIDVLAGKSDRSAAQAVEAVEHLDERIENTQWSIAPFMTRERVQFFWSRIQQLQSDAHQALEKGDYKLVMLNTQFANDLIDLLLKKLKEAAQAPAEILDPEPK